MSGVCPGIVDGAFLQSVLGFVDCQAQSIGTAGYQVLSAPGSPLSLMLTAFLTLFIAFIGYRMLLGETPGVRDGVLAFVKIGIVLALATSWPAYRTLVYDVAFHGPAELVANVGGSAGLPAATGGLASRLELVDDALIELGSLGNGPAGPGTLRTGTNGEAVAAVRTEPPSMFTPFALGTGRLVFLTATIASFASVRLVAGLLLALGPFFVAFLLFEGTRSLFEGWIRGLAAAAIGALAVTLLLTVELALLEPWLATLIARRQAALSIGGAPTELLVVTLAFALALLGGLGMAARLATAFRLAPVWRSVPARVFTALQGDASPAIARPGGETRVPAEQQSRAAAVAEAVAHIQRREALAAGVGNTASRAAVTAPAGRDIAASPPARLGQSHRRRTQGRISASAGRRDLKA